MIENHGVLNGRRGTDFSAGVLPYQIRLPSGNWKLFDPPGKVQIYKYGDVMACVTYAAINSLRMQEKLLTGEQPAYSQRWIAKMSGTDVLHGNYLYKVADTIIQYGLVLESDYPDPDPNDPNFLQVYYQDIPEPLLSTLKTKGQQWLQTHTVQYEWENLDVPTILYHLKQAPLQVVIPGHSIVEIVNEQTLMEFFDSYDPYVKQTNQSEITSALKLLLTTKGYSMAKVLNDAGTIRIEFGSGPTGFNIGVASSSLFQQIQASGEPILVQPATTPEKLTLTDGMVLHPK